MKIWIDTSFELKEKTGVGAYILTLIDALKLIDNVQCEEFNCSWDQKGLRAILHLIWLNTIFYIKTLFSKPDVILFPNFRMPIIKVPGVKYIVTIHDLAMFKGYLPDYATFNYRMTVMMALKSADKIMVVSKEIKQELNNKFPNHKQAINVVYNSPRKNLNISNKEILRQLNIQPKEYIFAIGSCYKGKNIIELINAFNKISSKFNKLKLIITGRSGNVDIDYLINRNNNIIRTGYIADEEVSALYQNALLHVFPSLYEGFGTPIVEAQYSKTPLLCSDIPVFREIAGDGAEFCSTDYIGIAEKIEYLINNHQRMEELIRLGSENVKRFDIERVAEQLKKVIYD